MPEIRAQGAVQIIVQRQKARSRGWTRWERTVCQLRQGCEGKENDLSHPSRRPAPSGFATGQAGRIRSRHRVNTGVSQGDDPPAAPCRTGAGEMGSHQRERWGCYGWQGFCMLVQVCTVRLTRLGRVPRSKQVESQGNALSGGTLGRSLACHRADIPQGTRSTVTFCLGSPRTLCLRWHALTLP